MSRPSSALLRFAFTSWGYEDSRADRGRTRADGATGGHRHGGRRQRAGSSLIYAPAFYSSTAELIALCRVAARYGGRYISHMRSEGADLLGAAEN
jgi:hypothetical protein